MRVPRRIPQAPSRVIDGQGVVIQTKLAEVSLLNEVGTRVWAAIDGKKSEQEIARLVAEEFEVSEEEAAKDVAAFLDELATAQLVEIA